MRRGTRLFAPVTALVALFVLTACPQDPFDPRTWIKKLDDPREWTRAVQELERLGEPVAIEPLTEAWERHNRSSRVLRAIIDLADQPDEEGGPFWDDALPVLLLALEEYRIEDDRSREDAVAAARALGQAGDPQAIPVLISAATQSMPRLSPAQRVRREALFALGKFGESERAVDTLVRALQADPEDQRLELHAAAAMALGETRSERAIEPLLQALFEISPIYQQVRAALTQIGEPAIPELIRVFEGEHDEINEFAKEHGFAENCGQAIGPDTDCKAPGNLQFKSAAVLGDLRAEQAVPVLMSALGERSQVAFFDPQTGAPGPPSHEAILDALAKIGDERAIAPMRRYWTDRSTDDSIRPLAIDKYSMISRSHDGIGRLVAYMRDDSEEEDLRKASALALARLISEEGQLGSLDEMIGRYRDAREEHEQKAENEEDEDRAARLRGQASGYRNFQRLFEQHKARALIGTKCSGDASCYESILTMERDELIADLEERGLAGASDQGSSDRSALQLAARERAILDLAKLGEDGRPALDTLLEPSLAGTSDRTTREAILIALPRIAPKPCDACEESLGEVIESQKDQSTLDLLTADTRIVKHYFSWAGR